jgi:hypothetical protein
MDADKFVPQQTRKRYSLGEEIMKTITDNRMGKVTTKITVTNRIDQILAERGFITTDQIRSIILENVLVDIGLVELHYSLTRKQTQSILQHQERNKSQ